MTASQSNLPAKGRRNKSSLPVPFDPTAPEDGSTSLDVLPDGEVPALLDLEKLVPTSLDVARVAREMFTGDLPDAVIRNLIAESEEVAHSTRKIMQEHMRIGGSFHQMMVHVINADYAQHGQSSRVQDRARQKVYDYIERVHKRSRSSAKLYIRCYEKFIGNQAAVQLLSITDMSLLIKTDIGDDIVGHVIEARRENPDLTKSQVKSLIAALKRSAVTLQERDEQLDVVNTELSATVHELDLSQSESRRLAEELDRQQRGAAADQENLRLTQANLDAAHHAVASTQVAITGLERERDQLRQQLADVRARPAQIVEKEVAQVPAAYSSLEEAVRDLSEKATALDRQIADKKAEHALLDAKLSEQTAAAENGQRVQAAIESMIAQFGEFQNHFLSAQLLVTAEGKPKRYAPLFRALTDQIAKMHRELVAVTTAS